MISVYISCYDLSDIHKTESVLNHMMIQFGGEQLVLERHCNQGDFKDEAMGVPEIIIFELRNAGDYKKLRELRDNLPGAWLLLINRSQLPSINLLEPGINPAAMSEDFWDRDTMKELFREIIIRIYKEREGLSVQDRLLARRGDGYYLLRYSEIIYIEAKDKYIVIHYRKGIVAYRDTLKSLEERLPPYFARCHRSIIVNLLFVYKVHFSMRHLCLEDGTIIPLSKSYRHELNDILTRYLTD